MALDADKVVVAVTGAVLYAPTATSAPTNSTSPAPVGFRDVGYISDDGVTENHEEDSETIQAWQNGAVVRTITTSSVATYNFKMIETNKNALELYYKGSTITGSGGAYVLEVTPPGAIKKSFILEIVDGNIHERIYLPSAEVTERGEVNRVSSDAVGYEVTVTAYPVPNGTGGTYVAKVFSDNPAWGLS